MMATLVLTLALALAGCGQPGDLYLPDEPPTAVEQPPPDPASEEARKKK
jgi:predicted small lipoprotein YifL